MLRPKDSEDFSVSIKNYRAWPQSKASMVESVKINLTATEDTEYTSFVIELKAGPLTGGPYPEKVLTYVTAVMNDGALVNYEVANVQRPDFKLQNSGAVATVVLSNGVKISFKALFWFCDIFVPPVFARNTEGLCGFYDQNRTNDLYGPDDFLYPNNPNGRDDFALSWAVGDQSVCDVNDVVECEDPAVEAACSRLIDPNDYFGQCHEFVNPYPYYTNCRVDLCEMNNGDSACLIYDLYLTACANAQDEANFCDWSEALGCAGSCGENEIWSDCASVCEDIPTCATPNKDDLECSDEKTITAMCICKDGYVNEGGKCILESDCGCDLGGIRLPNGYNYLNADCSIQCKCENNVYSCTEYECNPITSQCNLDPNNSDFGTCDSIEVGYCRGSGDPHFQTFDRSYFDVMGTCEYYMSVSAYNSPNHSPFAVRIQNYRRSPGQTVSYIESVYFDFESIDRQTLYTVSLSRNHNTNRIDSQVAVYTQKGTFVEYFDTANAQNDDLELVNDGNVAYVNTWFGVKVQHKISGYYCEIWAPGSYKSKLNGLCGNFDDVAQHDYFGADGILYDHNAQGAYDFSSTWIVHPNSEKNCHGPVHDECVPSKNVQDRCSKLKDSYFSGLVSIFFVKLPNHSG